jgi:hypothetical protein
MLREGRIALLFDGFDELTLRLTYDKALDHLDTLLEAAAGKAKVVVTSRTEHFLSHSQIRKFLYDKAANLDGFRIAELDPFTTDQIRCYLTHKLGNPSRAEGRLKLLQEVGDLHEVATNPRRLGFIAKIPEEYLRAAARRHGGITPAHLYQMLLDWWLAFEHKRAHPPGMAPALDLEHLWRVVSELALLMWTRRERTKTSTWR